MTQTTATTISRSSADALLRFIAWIIVAAMIAFLLNAYLTFWAGWPGAPALREHLGSDDGGTLAGARVLMAWLQFLLYPAAVVASAVFVYTQSARSLFRDSEALAALSAFIVRAAFWSVLLVGLADMTISLLRTEGLLSGWASDELITELGRASYRSTRIHYPLIALSLVVALFTRSIGFHWLALLVVIAEFQIVLARFIFSYEQAFMGDLVRFWYAALFLFASAYTLIHEGHVRVDVAYAHFSERGKAWANALGSLLLGIPICWIIIARGMDAKTSIITSPLINYEISQSRFGMYIKYLMAGFLLIYAVSMMIQFASYFLRSAAVLRGEKVPRPVEQETLAH